VDERSTELPPPTEAEIVAWDRQSPEVEAKLREWDKANIARLLGYWTDLACFRERVRAEGKLALGSARGSPPEERFFQFKRKFVEETNAWQQNLFTVEPRIIEKSHFIGRLLEAHELVAYTYPSAFSEGDQREVEKTDGYWAVVEGKTKKYAESLGATWKPAICRAGA
jgi:hypothetical protein